ncbi:glycoside hydrolase family 15 protein [Acidithiobacillus ferridurans]|uniref:Trehalase n=2 Tax=Acidithiobacillus ferridurans TaxID=1232575 RepID=A0A2Z6IH23_ACIFI|nr:glycoside hydrolase family 15 protein [Acidithiobacillus ferridurans]MBU2724554.1 glycoside hydrolase family 15 protein [Acidithiobacillus ferridurans]MBU2726758.1 glycoside hydrolase family 15 protein [Acidithiobacillus ferridurans]BBF63847.1 Trehalase [Acidithiobacillus ferridurans]
MSLPIEDYALIGDCHTAALVGSDGSIDWLCFPRFDSGACFAALLGEPEHGRWLIAPVAEVRNIRRKYRPGTLILETDFEADAGAVRIIDFMSLSEDRWDVLRIVEGLRGRVAMRMELIIRFDYGSIMPWVQRSGDTLLATAGPDRLELRSEVAVHGENMKTMAEFHVSKGERINFALNYRPSYEAAQSTIDPEQELVATENEWRKWSKRCTYQGRWRDAVLRSLITLKALTYAPTGGIIAAPTTSLPEQHGGVRNWDYRYCWLRDATFTLNALLLAGYHEEAVAWREWLLRAIAGSPESLQTLYSVTGERRLEEYVVDWLPGYGRAVPVRLGNAASKQFQLDVYGEVMDTLHLARTVGLDPEPAAWRVQVAILQFLESNWQQPDDGIWEMRGPQRHYTYSKVMAWVAFDRAVKDVEAFELDGPVERWRQVRDAIHAQVCSEGYDAQRNTFVQFYGAPHLDASLLLIPQVGFLPSDDPRVLGTIEAIKRDLVVDGLVLRYKTDADIDALPSGEGAFLPCSYWLAGSLALIGRREEAEALFERLLGLSNDVGLLAEEYDTRGRCMLGNFPQALTHTALINTAYLLSIPEEQAKRASEAGERPAAVLQTS